MWTMLAGICSGRVLVEIALGRANDVGGPDVDWPLERRVR
jgi:hypothetical protein